MGPIYFEKRERTVRDFIACILISLALLAILLFAAVGLVFSVVSLLAWV